LSFGFLLAAFLATANPARVALAALESRPRRASLALAVAGSFALAAVAALLSDNLLDVLDVSPESFRIAAGLVLGVAGLRALVSGLSFAGPFGAVVVTPELAVLAVSAGADQSLGRVLGAVAVTLLLVVPALAAPRRGPLVVAARFLGALQVVVAVALVVSGVRDV
jgi:small neutral amino acid transporter SnatA (MarC family)